jgi:hypothetical protein
VIAHVGGLPVEEVLPMLMSGVGAIWLTLRVRAGRGATRVADPTGARERDGQR